MHEQLWPLYIVGGVYSIYTLKCILILWDEASSLTNEHLEDLITDVTPISTPFSESIKNAK
jgi:hypothetical protein